MPLPTELVDKDRKRIADDYVMWIRLRNPDAKTGPGEGAWVDGHCIADQIVMLNANARILSGRATLAGKTGPQLDEFGATINVPRGAKAGASGFVIIQAGVSGTTIISGDELYCSTNGLSYYAKRTKALDDGDQIDVQCVESGPNTNLDAGETLTWSAPRPGCYATSTVFEKPDGTGLSGGRDVEADDDYRRRLALAISNPAAAGNDAEVQRLAEDIDGSYVLARYGSELGGHGVPVEKAYTYPALLGPGTIGLAFTLKPESATGSRVATAEQMTSVYQHVTQWLPSDDGVIPLSVIEEGFDIVVRVKWASSGWEDTVAWPPYMAEGSHYCVMASTNATAFSVGCADAVYTSRAAPQIGDAFAVFDPDYGVFRRKAVATVTGTGPWAIVCDTAAEASDVTFKPSVGARVSPWSDSLDSIASCLTAAVAGFGPGEATSLDPGDGRRMLRSPGISPTSYPIGMTSRALADIADLTAVSRFSVIVGEDTEASDGDASTVNLLELADIGVLPL
jgi:hypothetical protein